MLAHLRKWFNDQDNGYEVFYINSENNVASVYKKVGVGRNQVFRFRVVGDDVVLRDALVEGDETQARGFALLELAVKHYRASKLIETVYTISHSDIPTLAKLLWDIETEHDLYYEWRNGEYTNGSVEWAYAAKEGIGYDNAAHFDADYNEGRATWQGVLMSACRAGIIPEGSYAIDISW